MKSFILKNAFWAMIISLGTLTSCLSNDDPYLTSNGDFAYITTVSGTRCAATSYGYVTNSAIQNLKLNECYIISYSYKSSDLTTDGIYMANEFQNVSGDPIEQTTLRFAPVPVNEEANFQISDLTIPAFSSTDYLGNRWAFTYTLLQKEEEVPVVNFYYDVNNQIDSKGEDIKKDNKIIIDVDFVKNSVEPLSSSTEFRRTVIGNLDDLKRNYKPDFTTAQTGSNDKKYVSVLLQFRYKKYNKETGKSETAYLGSFDTTTPQRIYYMTFEQ